MTWREYAPEFMGLFAKQCDECADLGWCRKIGRCIRRQIPHWEDEQAMREYAEGLRRLLARQQEGGR